MPELPEVETARRSLARRLAGRSILSCSIRFPGVLSLSNENGNLTLPARFVEGSRHGKILYLLFDEDKYLLAHFRMTGGFYFRKDSDTLRDHTHVEFTLDDGEILAFRDPRRFGGLWWYEGKAVLTQYPLSTLGPDVLILSQDQFIRLMRMKNRMIKPLLLDQSVLAGMGNIYVDECLFRARIHPMKSSNRISTPKLRELWKTIQEVLAEAIEYGGSSIRDYADSDGRRGGFQDRHWVYNKKGEPCVRCGNPIRRILVAQRGTWICKKCQRR